MHDLTSYPKLIPSLQKLVFFERASAHILAGSLPKVRDLSIKIGASYDLYASMHQAHRLRNILAAHGYKSPNLLWASQAWVDLMIAIDSLPDAEDALAALYLRIRPRLLNEYREILANADRLFDDELLRAIRSHLPSAEAKRNWLSALAKRDKLLRITEKGDFRNDKLDLPLDHAIWQPIDRAPMALRPLGSNTGENGELPVIPHDVLSDPTGVAIFLHNNINEEYATFELSGRNSYEHPDMAWEFHLGMAHHVADEARHAELQERLLAEYGVRYGDYPFCVTNYDMLYSFDQCRPGSKHELLWRLLVRSTYQEGLALDFNAFEIQRRSYLCQQNISRVFHHLLMDEISHVENGLRWSRKVAAMCGLDAMEERNKARDYYLARETHERLRFVVRHPERAIVEGQSLELAQQHNNNVPNNPRLNVDLRRRAGFSDGEIEQVRAWGIYSE